MAHEFRVVEGGKGSLGDIDREALREARIDLAACFRMAARYGLEEGICNHFSAMVPGRDDLFLVNPYGLAFCEVTASSLLICDFHGRVVEGEGQPEATAFYRAVGYQEIPRFGVYRREPGSLCFAHELAADPAPGGAGAGPAPR